MTYSLNHAVRWWVYGGDIGVSSSRDDRPFTVRLPRDEASVEYLTSLLKTFRNYRCAVELRHRSWSDDFDPTLTLLNEHDAAFVQIDEPKFKTSIRQNQLPISRRSITSVRKSAAPDVNATTRLTLKLDSKVYPAC